jgi:IS30 family transposase
MTSAQNHIKTLKAAGMTLAAIAKAVGVHPNTICNIKRGGGCRTGTAESILAIQPPVARAKKRAAQSGPKREETSKEKFHATPKP